MQVDVWLTAVCTLKVAVEITAIVYKLRELKYKNKSNSTQIQNNSHQMHGLLSLITCIKLNFSETFYSLLYEYIWAFNDEI